MMHYSDQMPLSETSAIVPELASGYQCGEDAIFVGSALHKKTLTFIRYALLLDAIDEGWLYEQQGWMFNQLQHYREALDAFDRARQLGYANDGWLYKQKSYALNKLERADEALEAGERARRLGYIHEE
jgi:tetratricopeptide (TPR) repeat protein